MTAPPAPAPDDLCRFDCDHVIAASQHQLSANCPICLHAEIGELTAALAARDAEIERITRLNRGLQRATADLQADMQAEIAKLRAALRRASEALYNAFEPDNQSAAWWEVQRALAALAAERTQGDTP